MGLFSWFAGKQQGEIPVSISPLEPADRDFLEQCRGSLDGRTAGFDELHQTLAMVQGSGDKDVLFVHQVGVALGDKMVDQFGLEWAVVTDQVGRSLVVAVKGKLVFAAPIDMVAKRVGLSPDLAELCTQIGGILKKRASQTEALRR